MTDGFIHVTYKFNLDLELFKRVPLRNQYLPNAYSSTVARRDTVKNTVILYGDYILRGKADNI